MERTLVQPLFIVHVVEEGVSSLYFHCTCDLNRIMWNYETCCSVLRVYLFI